MASFCGWFCFAVAATGCVTSLNLEFLAGEKSLEAMVAFRTVGLVSITGVYSVCDLLIVALSDALAQNLRVFNDRLRMAVRQVRKINTNNI